MTYFGPSPFPPPYGYRRISKGSFQAKGLPRHSRPQSHLIGQAYWQSWANQLQGKMDRVKATIENVFRASLNPRLGGGTLSPYIHGSSVVRKSLFVKFAHIMPTSVAKVNANN